MAYKYYTITEICDWYQRNVNHALPNSLLQHMIDTNIITHLPNKRYSLSEVNNFLLQKEDCEYLKDENGKFMFKENRIVLLEKYKNVNSLPQTQFTFTKLKGNKLKLIKNG